jgi:hypothetical protein
MERQNVMMEISQILDTYCNDCFVRDHLRKTYGKNYAQRFCIQICSVGQELKKCGKQLVNK